MKFDQLARAQNQYEAQVAAPPPTATHVYPTAPPTSMPMPAIENPAMYPSLTDYMGLELSEAIIAANMPEYTQVAVVTAVSISELFYSCLL